jgi:hypothetical protein
MTVFRDITFLATGPASECKRSAQRRVSAVAIEELVAFIPPPATPIDGEGDWSVAEGEFGIAFPADFKQLIRRYGTGRFYGDLRVANPLQPWGRDLIRDDLARYGELRDACEMSLKLFPESPGLLPWGGDSNGHLYCWWTEGAPDSWRLVQVFHGYEEEIEPVLGPITSFLVRFISNEYPNMLGGNPFSAEDRYFEQGIPWLK